MYFLYLDESGNPNISKTWFPESDFFVLGGAIVSEKNYKTTEQNFRDFKNNNLPEKVREKPLHAVRLNNIIQPSNPYFGHLNYAQGREILAKAYEFLATQPIETIGVIIDNVEHRKKYTKPQNPYELAYQFILERFQQAFTKNNPTELGQVNLAASQRQLKYKITNLHKKAITEGTNYMKLPNIISTININPVTDSSFYEIADLICYAHQREYSNWLRLEMGKKIYDTTSYLNTISSLAKIPTGKQINGNMSMKIFPEKREI